MRVECHCTRCAPNIDYGFSEAQTTYGIIGVKVWVYKGDPLGRNDAPLAAKDSLPPPERDDRRGRRPPPGAKPPGGPRGVRRKVEGEDSVAGKDAPEKNAPETPVSTVKRVRKAAAPAAPAAGDVGAKKE